MFVLLEQKTARACRSPARTAWHRRRGRRTRRRTCAPQARGVAPLDVRRVRVVRGKNQGRRRDELALARVGPAHQLPPRLSARICSCQRKLNMPGKRRRASSGAGSSARAAGRRAVRAAAAGGDGGGGECGGAGTSAELAPPSRRLSLDAGSRDRPLARAWLRASPGTAAARASAAPTPQPRIVQRLQLLARSDPQDRRRVWGARALREGGRAFVPPVSHLHAFHSRRVF